MIDLILGTCRLRAGSSHGSLEPAIEAPVTRSVQKSVRIKAGVCRGAARRTDLKQHVRTVPATPSLWPPPCPNSSPTDVSCENHMLEECFMLLLLAPNFSGLGCRPWGLSTGLVEERVVPDRPASKNANCFAAICCRL